MIKNFTKLMLTAILLVAGVGGVKARDVYATLSSGVTQNSATWAQVGETSAYTYGWSNTGDDYISLFTAFGGIAEGELDWSDGISLNLDLTELGDNSYNALAILIVANGKTFKRELHSTGSKTLTLTATSGDGFRKDGWDEYITATDLEHVTDVQLKAINKYQQTLTASSATVSNILVQISPKATLNFNASGVATIDLKELDVTGSGLSYNSETGEVTSTGTSGTILLSLNNANLSNVTNISVNVSTGSPYTDICNTGDVVNSAGNSVNGGAWYGSRYNMNLGTSQQALAGQVTTIKWNVNATGTMKINSITITANPMKVVNAHDIPIATLPHYAVAEDGTVSQTTAISTNYGSVVEIPLGDGNSNMDEYIDIADYDELRIYTSDNARVFFINVANIATGTSGTDGAIAKLDNSVAGQVTFNHNTSEGYYYANVSDIKNTYNGQAKIIGVKGASWQAKLTVSKIQVYKENPTYDFIISGQYSSATDVSAVTSSTTATAIDCSNLSGNGATITAGNPNCLFVAKSGVLANTNNVIVDGTCASLVLTDGYPFKAPSDFTATAAPTYNRAFTASTMTTVMTTVCLPFALTETEAATLGTFYQLSTFDGVDLHFTSVPAPLANKPYLVIPTNAGISLSEKGKSIAATPDRLGASITYVEFIGTLAATAIPASDGTNSYFAFDNGSLVKITSQAATLPAFRGYFKVTTSAINGNKARRLGVSFGNEATGISDATRLKDKGQMKNDIFDLQGRRVKTFKKGLYIVNGKKVIK